MNIKNWVGYYMLNRSNAITERQIKAINLRQAQSVGLIYDSGDEKIFNAIKNYYRLLKQEGVKNIEVLGYVDEKQLPVFLTPERDFDYFSIKEVNWYGKPISQNVLTFANKNFDILIDLSLKENLPLQFILAMSQAHLKVGASGLNRNNLLDLIINLKEDQGINYLIKNVSVYLNMLNKTN